MRQTTRLSLQAATLAGAAALISGLAIRPAAASVIGTLGNFDVVNDTGQSAYGFEIDLEGISVSDVTDTFGGAGRYFPPTVERYGSPAVSATPTGVSIVYKAQFTGGSWSVSTPSGVFNTPGESCWTGGNIGYGPSTPCDHFGVGTSKTPTKTKYSWLTAPSATTPTLTPVTANLPAPLFTVTPNPPAPGNPAPPPFVAAVVQAPPPPNPGEPQFGTAQWVKVFTTEYDHPVALEDLMGGNGIVPQDAAETEIEWQLLQTDPGDPLAGMLELGGDAGAGAESVLRRYEFYKYVGAVDPENGEALSDIPLLDLLGNPIDPANGGNIGAFIGAQNNAVNLNGVYVGPPAGVDVPEPGTLAVLGTALLSLIGLRRRAAKA
jgi:hypothetical protein